ncbi:MAG: Gfo/Idh/MocA family oxidoreductase [Clostridia bacterium]|nr:Gfo/Idh/MocA family oxidoreductase [Clostridia bacterium]
MDTVRVGIIGIGNIGSAHAKCIADNKVNGLTLSALCDLKPEKNSLYPDIPFFNDSDSLINSGLVDAVIVSTPHKFHIDIAEKALLAGLHVLVEKPVDISISKAKQINRIAEKSDKVFAIMFNQRTNPLFKRAREIVKSGALGELKRSVWIITNWYRTQHYYDSGEWRATWSGEGGGVLLNQAPHQLDLWQWICGMPTELYAVCDIAKYHNIEVEDDVTITARYENRATGVFITSTGEYPGTNRLEISGTKGKIVLEGGALKWWRLLSDERDVCFASDSNSPKIETEYEEIVPDCPETAHRGILQNFANAILHGETLISPGTEGINELMISNAAYLSAEKKRTVTLPIDATEFDRFLIEKIKNSSKKNDCVCDSEKDEYSPRWRVKW